MMKPGDKVKIEPSEEGGWLLCRWWPKGEVTGTVQKIFKNGNIAVAVDRVPNQSEDRLKTLHFQAVEVKPL